MNMKIEMVEQMNKSKFVVWGENRKYRSIIIINLVLGKEQWENHVYTK